MVNFFWLCCFMLNHAIAQDVSLIGPQSKNQNTSASSASQREIPNTFMVHVNAQWVKAESTKMEGVNTRYQMKCMDESFGLYRFVGNKSDLLLLKEKANLAGIPFDFQPEHYIQRRAGIKPNDPLLSDQPFLDVIQMPLAWEQGLAGVNRYGDTLVEIGRAHV